MPASTTDYTKIRELQESAASKTKAGRGIAASAGTLGDNVMQAVRADRTSRGVSKLSTDVGNVMGQMVTDPTGIRERTSGIVDPLSVNRLTSAARAENLRTLGTVATQRGLTEATMQETIQAGANRLEAQAKELYAQAEEATAQATTLQDEWDRMYKEKQDAADEAFRQKQFAADEAYRYRPADSETTVHIPEVGEVSREIYDSAMSVLSGGNIKNISMAGGLRGSVQNLITSLASNPTYLPEVLSSVDQLTLEATNKLGMIQEVQGTLNKEGKLTGPLLGGIKQWLGQSYDVGGTSEFWDKFSRLGGESLFQIGGKTLPSQEKGEISSFIPRKTKGDIANVKSLDTMYEKLFNESAAEIAKQARERGISLSDKQIKDYINSQLGSGDNEIRVRKKDTGETGTIPSSEFDEEVYERI